MTAVMPQTGRDAKRQETKRDERRAAGVAFGAHALHDGYTDLIYVMLPVWQTEFGLGYAALGVLRGLFSGPWPVCRSPPVSSPRGGALAVLALGTLLTGAAYMLAAGAAGSSCSPSPCFSAARDRARSTRWPGIDRAGFPGRARARRSAPICRISARWRCRWRHR